MEQQTILNPLTEVVEEAPTSLDMAPEDPPPLDNGEGGKKVRDLALRQLNRFISYEAKVLKGDDGEAIHDMRVASRRLQQLLDLLYPKPRPVQLRPLRRKIRRCRQALGEVRNCDVLLEFVRRSLARKRSARREAWTAVQQFLVARRLESFQQTLRKFGKINLTGFYVDLKELLSHDDGHGHATGHHAHRAEASSLNFLQDLTRALDSTWRGFEEQINLSHQHPRPEIIHGARIATKRLRYLIEVFHELQIPGSADALVGLRHLQKHLGDWHDLEVLEHMMIEMLARPDFLRDHLTLAMEVEKLVLRNRETKQGFAEKYSLMSMESAEMRRLKEWVAYRVGSPSAALAKG